MKISIFGLGYVGMVNAVCLAQAGHEVYGIDVNPHKVHLVQAGRSPITEVHVEPLLVAQRGASELDEPDLCRHPEYADGGGGSVASRARVQIDRYESAGC
jgi:UDP-N-acetyl-D-mannosaminuronate dehydrogenase